ncbi:E3 ubiquitin-protein ligase SSM4 NDAI_0A02770 [Naumovozyma dairenensis CBS 421]|uniref:RING-type E3 ubiquitin transferase n=1 Tax=Naumovozyma dairenensis (strain ATCC 10597 / BCRC 20456 / CBS 421 / NBRC 0211 / NRRL Y-12639) TaxID=1071378 RepID=G0W3P7_NAUDC|nr:hypothetical protein NDAI_0A02770 [Naumovozyma dairenensis CBS 421]CCD22435.1 hypothetical protein NDAI_0A02770 [Naumovozyma dairenensis CBS 421]
MDPATDPSLPSMDDPHLESKSPLTPTTGERSASTPPGKQETISSDATCRVCRGEATDDNPLFHPCKCKGSIKYIHESCLLEWIASKNLDISKPGTKVNCDICHYPIHFKTTYVEDMPDRIPLTVLIKKSILSLLGKLRVILTLSLTVILLGFGIPIAWNVFGKLYTFALDGGELPIKNEFWKSVLFGYNEITDPSILQNLSLADILTQLSSNVSSSVIQISLIIILHIALYFQYDMIVREDVFNKMVFHKIGPKLSTDDIKERLRARFPMIDEQMLNHLAEAMRARELGANQPANAADDHQNRPNVEDAHQRQNHNIRRPQHNHMAVLEGSDEDEYNDPDFVPHDHTDESDNISLNPDENEDELVQDEELHDMWNDNEQHHEPQQHQQVRPENMDDHMENPFEGLMNRRAQNQFDRLIDEQRQQQQANNNVQGVDPIHIDVQEQEADPLQQEQQGAPLILNIRLRLFDVFLYFTIGITFAISYLLISYFIPTAIGYGLLKLYFGIVKIIIRGLVQLYYLTKINKAYETVSLKLPFLNQITAWIGTEIINGYILYYYNGYQKNAMKTSFCMRALPTATTYFTAIAIICIASEWICKGYSRTHGMPGKFKRLAFQLLFAFKCTFKVFTLFFIELAGFPILAGVMIDLSLFTPVLKSYKNFLCIPELTEFWPPSAFFIYWTIGTLYMYWFAKYIGMIRQDIIRPGVLFFIRSPEDPNIRILHDSLIHPMNIQLSRLSLSMFIYAVFIIAGFGFHTRFFFPLVLRSKVLQIGEQNEKLEFNTIFFMLNTFYLAKKVLESNKNVKRLVKEYWTSIFNISSKKLRLSSFILGKDIPTERGHILYRNMFYKFLANNKAKWSNPELYSDPKTTLQAKQLFQENKSVHAYFIPDGVLLRVPSSDIVSRNYVQTMFVPVTKDDQLLKPVDLERIKERNRRNAGEFGYLDQQNTEFDEYFICYVPPNFRPRYIILIILMWLFASVLMLSLAFVSQMASNIVLAAIVLPIARLMNENYYQTMSNILARRLKRASFHGIAIGAVALTYFYDRYKIYQASIHGRNEHVVNENEHAHPEEEVHPQVEDFDLNNEAQDIVGVIVESTFFKMILGFLLSIVSTSLAYFDILINVEYGLRLSCSYIFLTVPTLISLKEYIPYDFEKFYYLYQVASFPYIFKTLFSSIKIFHEHGNVDTLTFLKIYVTKLYEDTLKNMLVRTIPLLILLLIFSVLDIILNPGLYSGYNEVTSFLLEVRLSSTPTDIPWTLTQHLYYCTLSIFVIGYIIWETKSLYQKWSKFIVQNVKDEVYAKGRSLENLPDEITEDSSDLLQD